MTPKTQSATAKVSRLKLFIMVTAQFMVILDASIVNVALDTITHALHFSTIGAQGVITAYATAFASVLVLGGRIADIFGRKRIFIVGLIAFSLASLACGLAPTAPALIIARLIQGIAAGFVAPAAISLLTTTFAEGTERNKALSIFGFATVSGYIGGLLAGGVLVQTLGWPSIFYINVPVGLGIALLAVFKISPVAPHAKTRIDLVGAALITVSIALLVYAPSNGASAGWLSLRFIIPLMASVFLLMSFIVWERRQSQPLVMLSIFQKRSFRTATILAFSLGALQSAGLLIPTLYLQEVMHFTALHTSLAIAPIGVTGFLASLYAAKLITRWGLRAVATVTMTAAALTMFGLAATFSTHDNYPVLCGLLMVAGACFTIISVCTTIGTSMGVADEQQGLAGGLRQTAYQIGVAAGVAVLLSVASTVSHGSAHGIITGYRLALAILATLVGLTAYGVFNGFRQLDVSKH